MYVHAGAFTVFPGTHTSQPDYQHVIDSWPSRVSTMTNPKVPTELRAIRNGFQWGFEIPSGAKRSKYFKLLVLELLICFGS